MKKIHKILTLIITVLVIAAIILTAVIKKKINDKTVNIGFYGVSEEMRQMLQDAMPQEENVIIKYTVIAENNVDLAAIAKKFDVLFTWKGEITDILNDNAEKIPKNYLEQLPKSLRNERVLPILLDNYELDFKAIVAEKAQTNPTESFSKFLEYLNETKEIVFSPFFMNSMDDRVLFAFVGNIIESEGGSKAYSNFINSLKEADNLSSIMDISFDEKQNVSLRSVMDMLKKWPDDGIAHPMWYSANEEDVRYFASSNQVAVFYTSLANHREYDYQFISEYVSVPMPYLTDSVDHGILAPQLCAMLLSNNSNSKRYLKELISEENQEAFSMKTMLGPVQYTAQAFDKQADDVRFWAASCPSGALPDPALAAFQRNPEKMKKFAEEMRSYFKK